MNAIHAFSYLGGKTYLFIEKFSWEAHNLFQLLWDI